MLQDSLPASQESTRPSSPHRRIQALGASSSNQGAPPGAEFVGSTPISTTAHGISSAAFSQNYFKNFFIEERELGRGGKGVVLLVKHVLDGVSLGHFALKRIPVGDNHEWLEKVLVEVQLLQHLSHQNLVSYRHVWLEEMQITTFSPPVPCAFVLQQYCNSGDLQNYILGGVKNSSNTEQLKQRLRRRSKIAPEPPSDIKRPRKLHFEEIYAFFKDIASGLNHLHINNYIHRDLKPNNCLLHDTGKELRVLVSDFGEVQSEDQIRQSTGATGTISYCAPEVLRRDPSTGRLGNFTTKSDIFSLGMILYFLCFAKLPYRNADDLHEENEDVDLLRAEIIAWEGLEDLKSSRPDLPDKLYTFLDRLLSLDPTVRPSAEEILQGIKTGSGLKESPERMPRHSGHVYEDIPNASGISSIDSPPSNSPSPSRLQALSRFGRPAPPSNLKLTLHPEETDSEADSSAEAAGPITPSSLVLRSRHASPVELRPPSPTLPHLLRRLYYLDPQTLLTVKTVVFLVKIISIYFPCLPVAVRPAMGLSILALATVDFLLFGFGVVTSMIFMILHVVFLVVTIHMEGLCLPKVAIVNDWSAY